MNVMDGYGWQSWPVMSRISGDGRDNVIHSAFNGHVFGYVVFKDGFR